MKKNFLTITLCFVLFLLLDGCGALQTVSPSESKINSLDQPIQGISEDIDDFSSTKSDESAVSTPENVSSNGSVNSSTESTVSTPENVSSDGSVNSSTEGPVPPEGQPLDFSFRVSYTDKIETSGIYPYGNLISSFTHLTTYTEKIKQHDLFVTDRIVDDVLSYDLVIKTYDEKWFESKSLIILVVEGSESKMPTIREVKKSGANLLTVIVDDLGEDREQIYHVFVEVDANDIEKGDSDLDTYIDIYQ